MSKEHLHTDFDRLLREKFEGAETPLAPENWNRLETSFDSNKDDDFDAIIKSRFENETLSDNIPPYIPTSQTEPPNNYRKWRWLLLLLLLGSTPFAYHYLTQSNNNEGNEQMENLKRKRSIKTDKVNETVDITKDSSRAKATTSAQPEDESTVHVVRKQTVLIQQPNTNLSQKATNKSSSSSLEQKPVKKENAAIRKTATPKANATQQSKPLNEKRKNQEKNTALESKPNKKKNNADHKIQSIKEKQHAQKETNNSITRKEKRKARKKRRTERKEQRIAKAKRKTKKETERQVAKPLLNKAKKQAKVDSNKRINRFRISMGAFAQQPATKLSADSRVLQTLYKQGEVKKWKVNAEMQAEYRLNKKWSVGTGVSMSSYATSIGKSNFVRDAHSNIVMDTTNKIIAFESSVGQTQVTGLNDFEFGKSIRVGPAPIPVDTFNSFSYTETQSFQLVQIPLFIQYTGGNKRFHYAIATGPLLSLVVKAQSNMEIYNTFFPDDRVSLTDYHKTNNLLWGATARLGLQYDISKSFGIHLSPTFNYISTDLSKYNFFSIYPHSFRVPLGIIYKF